ncbi:DUF2303 family protein [Helicobacter sp. UBA3407]|uniref:DUF2303 family protein n=1 Tax=Helicobacter TaxID=209 RepID=UPI0026092553|nr:DUF2303 family protein [Helicobacter sp. UBA3407]
MEKETKVFQTTIPSVEVDGYHFLHKDYHLAEECLKEPINKGFSIKVDDKESFVALVQEYKQENSKIFYNFQSVKAKIDFHKKEAQCFNNRLIELSLERHPFYEEFLKQLNMPLSQRDFIAFLKSFYMFLKPSENAISGIDLIDLSTHLSASSKIDSVQKHTSSSFCLATTIKSGAKEEVEIPSKLVFEFQMLGASEKTITLELELFINLKESSFEIKMMCYDIKVKEEAVLKSFIDALKQEIALPCYKVQ